MFSIFRSTSIEFILKWAVSRHTQIQLNQMYKYFSRHWTLSFQLKQWFSVQLFMEYFLKHFLAYKFQHGAFFFALSFFLFKCSFQPTQFDTESNNYIATLYVHMRYNNRTTSAIKILHRFHNYFGSERERERVSWVCKNRWKILGKLIRCVDQIFLCLVFVFHYRYF